MTPELTPTQKREKSEEKKELFHILTILGVADDPKIAENSRK